MAKGSSKTLFVGGLSIYLGEQELYEYFQNFSKVLKVVFLKDRDTGKSKGYAFVTLKDADVAYELALRKHVIMGRQVECQVAARKCEKVQNSFDRMKRKLYVTNITPHLSDAAFMHFFSAFGQVHNCYIIKNPELNCNRNYGFVEFEDVEVTNYLLKLQTPLIIGGVRIYIHSFKDKDNVKHEPESCTSEMPLNTKKSKTPKNGIDENHHHSTDSQADGSTDGKHQQKNQNEKVNTKGPQQPKAQQIALKKPLMFSQKHPIKGEARPIEEGSNYHLRVSRPGTSGATTLVLPIFSLTEGRHLFNQVDMEKCGHCQRFCKYKIATGSHLRVEPSSCSCQPTLHREFSLFFKGSGPNLAEVDRRKARVETTEVQDGANNRWF